MIAPCHHAFPSLDLLRQAGGRALLNLIERALDDFKTLSLVGSLAEVGSRALTRAPPPCPTLATPRAHSGGVWRNWEEPKNREKGRGIEPLDEKSSRRA